MTTLKNRITKWRNLSLAEQGSVLLLTLLLPLCALLLHGLGFKRCSEFLDSLSRRIRRYSKRKPVDLVQARRMAWLVAITARFGPYRAACLVRSLTLQFLLRCRGLDCQLRIGARHNDGQFEAHAWVVFNGQVINDQADVESRFSVFQPAPKFDQSVSEISKG
ncbi:MAG: lasso peptide biosynthesis B2 protein [Candidatus Competibacteraceae bacterium]|nr:lasso peptide biosynthesis B2 protein [Candidatus Competibacteraceae bacterium]